MIIRLNRILLVVFIVLLVVAGVSTVTANLDGSLLGVSSSSEGSGSISSGDESPTEENYYSDESNTGDIASEDNNVEDPLDEEYYDDSGNNNDDGDGGVHVRLDKHATAVPILFGLLSLLSIGVLSLKKER